MIGGAVKNKEEREEQKIAVKPRGESQRNPFMEHFHRVKTADRVYIASDHGGFRLKNSLVERFKNKDHALVDLGPHSLDAGDDYPDYAEKVCAEILSKGGSGILICRSGHGMAITANKFKGIYASVCCSEESAFKGKKDDNINVLCLAGDLVTEELAEKIVTTWLDTPYESIERRNRRFGKIREIEDRNFKS